MANVLERVESLPEWGIEPVPRERRELTALDLAVLWGDLGIGLLVLVTGALLVPGLGFWAALGVIVLGSVIGVALLALGAVAGAEHGIPTMVLFRPVLGIRGSWVPSVLNVLQLVGWTAVEFWAMSFVADLVAERVFGFSARWLWLAVTAVVCTGLALWGPVGVTRVWLKRFGAWTVAAICAAVTALVLVRPGLLDILSRPGEGGWPTFGLGLDLVIAMPISWLPLVADYTRFSNRPRAAGWGTAIGYFIANVWLYSLGALILLSVGETPDPAGIAAGILALGGGSIAGVLFLVGLLVGETDEAFADVYSGGVSLQNIFPSISQPLSIVALSAVATALAAVVVDVHLYESFLFLLGSVFVPLFGILAADHFVVRRRRIVLDQLYAGKGPYAGVRWVAFVPWLAGFVVYHSIAPTGPGWWLDFVASFAGTPLSERFAWLGASLPSFGTAFLLCLVAARLSSGRMKATKR